MRIINLFVGGVMCALVSACATPPKPTQPEGDKIVINPHPDLSLLVKIKKEQAKNNSRNNNNNEIYVKEIDDEISK